MREISGLTTTATPPERRGGSWKHTDLPEPVPLTTRQSLPPARASAAPSWKGRRTRGAGGGGAAAAPSGPGPAAGCGPQYLRRRALARPSRSDGGGLGTASAGSRRRR